jgi:hypothetical protein
VILFANEPKKMSRKTVGMRKTSWHQVGQTLAQARQVRADEWGQQNKLLVNNEYAAASHLFIPLRPPP